MGDFKEPVRLVVNFVANINSVIVHILRFREETARSKEEGFVVVTEVDYLIIITT